MLYVKRWTRGGKILLDGPIGEQLKLITVTGAKLTKKQSTVLPLSGWTLYTLLHQAGVHDIELCISEELKGLTDPWMSDGRLLPEQAIFKTKPWEHQWQAYQFSYPRIGSLLGIPMGGGKTKVVADLMANQGAERILILCPVAVRGVWPRELLRHTDGPWHFCIPTKGTIANRAEFAEQEMRLADARGVPFVLIVNHEAAWRPAFNDLITGTVWDILTVDECHRAKSPNGQFSRWLAKARSFFGKRIGLSGTPFAHLPPDIFPQARFLDPGFFGEAWTVFKSGFVEMGGFEGRQIVGIKEARQAEFAHLCEQFMFMMTQEEVDAASDVPDLLPPNDIPCEMNAKLGAEYMRLKTEFVAFLKEGEVTATNVLVKLIRLSQLCAGHVRTDDGAVKTVSDHKQVALQDRLLDATPPVVVGCRFREDLKQVRAVAEKLGWTYHEVSGAAKELADDGTMRPDTDILGCQIQSGSLGIDLTRSRHLILYSCDYNLVNYDQVIKRVHRSGQKHKVLFDRLVVPGTIDEDIIQALTKRRDINDYIRDLIRGEGV